MPTETSADLTRPVLIIGHDSRIWWATGRDTNGGVLVVADTRTQLDQRIEGLATRAGWKSWTEA